MTKLDVGRKTYEHVRRASGGGGKSWDELSDTERLQWMERIVALAFTSPVFA